MPKLPRIGVRLHQALDPHRCVALAMAAEAAGFASLWFAENPFHRAIMPALAACAVRTERIALGLGIVNFYQHHPTLIAAEFAALDELARGRARLGIGSGIGVQIRRLGLAYRPLSGLQDALHILRPLLRGKEVSYRGSVFSADGVALAFRAPRPDAPIYVASMGDRSLALCGRMADGLIVSTLCPPAYTARAAGIAGEAAAAAGRPSPHIVQYAPCAVGRDRADALRVAKAAIGGMLTSLWPQDDDWPPLRETIVRLGGIEKREMIGALGRLRRGEPAEGVLDDRFLAAFAIAGTAEDCLEQAMRYRQAGVDELVLTFAGPEPAAEMADLAAALGGEAARG